MKRHHHLLAGLLFALAAAAPALAQDGEKPDAPPPEATAPADDDGIAMPPGDGTLKPEYFTRKPYMTAPDVSPDGSRLAWIEGNQLVVYTIDSGEETGFDGGDKTLNGAAWIDSDYLVVYLSGGKIEDLADTKALMTFIGFSPLVFDRNGKYVRPLFAHDDKKIGFSDLSPIIRFVDNPKPSAITWEGDRTDIVDVATGKRQKGPRLLDGDAHVFDSQGRERLSVQIKDAKVSYGLTSITFRYRDAAGKVQTLKLPKQDKDNVYYITFNYSEMEDAIYWSEFNYATGVASIYRFDIATGVKNLFRSGDDKDMDIVLDGNGKVVGISTTSDRLHVEWTDPYYLKMMNAVQKLFPTATVDITDMTEDGRQIVFLISAPEKPDTYYQYDAEARELVELGGNYPELDGTQLASMTYITYKARDGLDIPAYITKRKDTPPGAPLIVFPHGGPAVRDVYGFDYQAQYFASKGYVVLQPQYRGSAGFGDTFQRAGNKHLDQMTTDLEDGVRYLQAQGMIDPKKVCVAGWSFGGYLAQAALTQTPDTYACGISGDGVSDLFEALDEENDRYWGGHGIEYWRSVLGKKGKDSDIIRATSPIEHIAAMKAPLLLIHGEFDPVVNVKQSERMNAAMKKAGKDVTYIPMKFMLHGPGTAEQRLTVLKAMDDFIAKAFGTYVAPERVPAPAAAAPAAPQPSS